MILSIAFVRFRCVLFLITTFVVYCQHRQVNNQNFISRSYHIPGEILSSVVHGWSESVDFYGSNYLFFVLPKLDSVSKIMVDTGGMWEKPLNMLYKDLVLNKRKTQPQFIPLVVDVGVNMGAFTLFAASMHSKVYGYDIQLLLLKLVHMGVAANDYGHLVILHDTAAWDQAGLNFTFSPERGNFGGTSIVDDIKKKRIFMSTSEKFQVVSSRIDETFKHSSLFFIKLDCEGCEPKALLGMDSIFLKGSVSHVVIEIRRETVYMLEALYYLGYVCSVFDDKEDCKYPVMSKETCGMPDFTAAVSTFNQRRPYSHWNLYMDVHCEKVGPPPVSVDILKSQWDLEGNLIRVNNSNSKDFSNVYLVRGGKRYVYDSKRMDNRTLVRGVSYGMLFLYSLDRTPYN